MTFLDVILSAKREEVEKMKEEYQRPSLYQTLKNQRELGVIAEIKRYSPSKGLLLNEENVVQRAITYEKGGASCISILTDEKFFKGSFLDLKAVSACVKIPLLCKDFIISSIQIDKAKNHGASVILLIMAALSNEQYVALYHYATSIGLEVLVEVHNEEELQRALVVSPKLLGINNRDLKTFVVNLETTQQLTEKIRSIDDSIVIISESGIKTQQDAHFVKECGVKGILVGEALMKTEGYEETIRELCV